jgi:hypothetical protein
MSDTTTDQRTDVRAPRHLGRAAPLRRLLGLVLARSRNETAPARSRYGALLWSLALLAVFVVWTLLAATWGPFDTLDRELNANYHVHRWWPELH